MDSSDLIAKQIEFANRITAIANQLASVTQRIDELTEIERQRSPNVIANMNYQDLLYDPYSKRLSEIEDENRAINKELIAIRNGVGLEEGSDSSIAQKIAEANNLTNRKDKETNARIDTLRQEFEDFRNLYGQPNGIATLDNSGRIPYSQLSKSTVEFKGFWNGTDFTQSEINNATPGDYYIAAASGKIGDTYVFERDEIFFSEENGQKKITVLSSEANASFTINSQDSLNTFNINKYFVNKNMDIVVASWTENDNEVIPNIILPKGKVIGQSIKVVTMSNNVKIYYNFDYNTYSSSDPTDANLTSNSTLKTSDMGCISLYVWTGSSWATKLYNAVWN